PQFTALITATQARAASGGRIALSAPDDIPGATALSDNDELRRVLTRILSDIAGSPIELAAGRSSSGGKAYEGALKHPLVRELLSRFEGDIVSRERFPHADFLDRYGDGTAEP
ncbi:MAG: hypothetical protein ACYTF0_06430, partial [Planctomycetota bacterium]